MFDRHSRRSGVALLVVSLFFGLWAGRSFAIERPAGRIGADDPDSLASLLESNPDDPPGWRALGLARLDEALATDSIADYLLAEEALLESERQAPGVPETTTGLALVNLGLHRFDVAHRMASEVVAIRPADARALGALVDAQIELGHYDDAADSLDRLLSLRPDAGALARLSYHRQVTGDSDGALEAMLQARTAASGLPDERSRIDVLVGEIHLQRGELDLAAASFEQALETSPGRHDARLGLAAVAHRQGRSAEALTLARDVSRRSADPAAYMLIAEFADSQEADRAVAIVTNLALDERTAGIGIDPGVVTFIARFGDPVIALDLAEDLHEQRPSNVFVAEAMAWAMAQNGREADAAGHARAALRFGPLGPNADRLEQLLSDGRP